MVKTGKNHFGRTVPRTRKHALTSEVMPEIILAVIVTVARNSA